MADGKGEFKSSFETGNGIKVENEGHIKSVQVPTYDESGAQNGVADAQAQGE